MSVTSSYQVQLWKLTGCSRRWCRRRTGAVERHRRVRGRANFLSAKKHDCTDCTITKLGNIVHEFLLTGRLPRAMLSPYSTRAFSRRPSVNELNAPLSSALEQPAIAAAALASTSSMRA